MTSGFDPFSLALFTALAPAGVVAFIVLALVRLARRDHNEAVRIDRMIALPFSVALIGFIASATHLGTPANALHVFAGVGRSPLSNEVLSAVVFLFLVGAYWMCAFKVNFPDALARIWLAVACAAGIVLLAGTALAYSTRTVLTWNTPFVPANLVLTACMAGFVLALLFLSVAQVSSRGIEVALVVLSLVALIVGTLSMGLQVAHLAGIANNETSALSLVPNYPKIIVVYAALGLAAIALATVPLCRPLPRRTTLTLRAAAAVLALVAVYLTRVVFYALHLTVGF